jgi:hypothetical protein
MSSLFPVYRLEYDRCGIVNPPTSRTTTITCQQAIVTELTDLQIQLFSYITEAMLLEEAYLYPALTRLEVQV